MSKFKRAIASVFIAALAVGGGVAAGPADAGQVRANWVCC